VFCVCQTRLKLSGKLGTSVSPCAAAGKAAAKKAAKETAAAAAAAKAAAPKVAAAHEARLDGSGSAAGAAAGTKRGSAGGDEGKGGGKARRVTPPAPGGEKQAQAEPESKEEDDGADALAYNEKSMDKEGVIKAMSQAMGTGGLLGALQHKLDGLVGMSSGFVEGLNYKVGRCRLTVPNPS